MKNILTFNMHNKNWEFAKTILSDMGYNNGTNRCSNCIHRNSRPYSSSEDMGIYCGRIDIYRISVSEHGFCNYHEPDAKHS